MSREISIMTPEHVELTFELAGLGSRFIALLLDAIFIWSPIIIAFILVAIFQASALSAFGNLFRSNWVIAITVLGIFALNSGYFLYFEAARNGQTPSKRLVGIRVIRDSGHPIDFRSALLRNLMRAVDWLPAIYAIGFIAIFLSPQYRRLGDIAAGTLVVKTHPKKDPAATKDTVREEEIAGNTPRLPEDALPYLNLITREDYRTMRHLLDRRHELDPHLIESLATKIASPLADKLHLQLADFGDPVLFLEQVGSEWERKNIR